MNSDKAIAIEQEVEEFKKRMYKAVDDAFVFGSGELELPTGFQGSFKADRLYSNILGKYINPNTGEIVE